MSVHNDRNEQRQDDIDEGRNEDVQVESTEPFLSLVVWSDGEKCGEHIIPIDQRKQTRWRKAPSGTERKGRSFSKESKFYLITHGELPWPTYPYRLARHELIKTIYKVVQ